MTLVAAVRAGLRAHPMTYAHQATYTNHSTRSVPL